MDLRFLYAHLIRGNKEIGQGSKRLISEDRDILYIGQHRHLYHYSPFSGRFSICLFVELFFIGKSVIVQTGS